MSATRPITDLRRDEKGAVMLTGLFMSCFLIGSLWFLIGIGDTIVFRDRMQEAADHGAFAAAALNAKGMNFISLCNLVLLAAVTVHILLGVIHDIALALCIVSLGLTCSFWVGMRRVYTGYFKVLKPAAKAIHTAEVVASFSYPVLGFAEGFHVGRSYRGGRGSGPVTVLPLSRTLVPGGHDYVLGLTLARSKRQGLLPVMRRPMSALCEKLAWVGVDVILEHGFEISHARMNGLVLKYVKLLLSGGLALRYCNGSEGKVSQFVKRKVSDKIKKAEELMKIGGGGGAIDPGFDEFWETDGPLAVRARGIFEPAAGNGGKFFQTRALNLAPRMTDESESRVGIARGPQRGTEKREKAPRPVGYMAQSEFFFDCDTGWEDVGCNHDENATYQIKWRARLRKLQVSKFVTSLLEREGGLPSPSQLKDLPESPLGEHGAAGIEALQPFLNLVPGLDAESFDAPHGASP